MVPFSASLLAAVHSDCVSVSIGGLILGLLLGALVFLIGAWLAGEAGQPIIRIIGAFLGVIVFVALAFDFTC